MFDDNPYERETQDIKNKEAIVDLNNVRRIMLLSGQKKFEQIIQTIEQTIQRAEGDGKQFFPENLESELKLLKIFYETINQGKSVDFNQCEQIQNEQKTKLILLDLNMRLKKNIKVDDRQIQQVVKMAYNNPTLKQQILLKIVGCRSIRRMLQISKQQIDDLTPDAQKKAIKFQIAADWKYILENDDQALELKQQSVQSWSKTKKTDRMNSTIKQFNYLIALCKGQAIDNSYVNKLRTMRKIVKLLEKVPQITNLQTKVKEKKKTVISIMIPHLIKQLQISTMQKEDKNVGTSILKKKGIVEERRQIGKKFLQQITKNNYSYCQFVPENRLENQKLKQLQKTIGGLKRRYMKIARQFWQNMYDICCKKLQQQKQNQEEDEDQENKN